MGNYSGNHPRYSKKGDEKYDAHEAYNKDLTASARLHYFENERHDKTHPGKQVVRTGNDLSENVEVRDMAVDAPGSYASHPYDEGHEGGTTPIRESSRDWGHGKHEYLRHRNAAGVETKTGDVGGGKYGKGGHFKAWEKNN